QSSSPHFFGDIDNDAALDIMAKSLTEHYLSQLAKSEAGAALRDPERLPNASIKDGTSNTMGVRESVTFSPGGRNIASARDSGVKIWDMDSGKKNATMGTDAADFYKAPYVQQRLKMPGGSEGGGRGGTPEKINAPAARAPLDEQIKKAERPEST